jgi:hypothetical protein
MAPNHQRNAHASSAGHGLNPSPNHAKHGDMTHLILTHRVASFASAVVLAAGIVAGCGSQQIRLTAPNTKAGIAYTCTSATTCYPASAAIREEGAKDEAIGLTLPPECNGQIHEILIRKADSSSPEIDVMCAQPVVAPPSSNATASAPPAP